MSGKISRPSNPPFVLRLISLCANKLKDLGYRSPFYPMRLKGKHPLKLLDSPNDPWIGSTARGADILLGKYAFAGFELHHTEGDLWDNLENCPPAFNDWLSSFSWLKDLETCADRRKACEKAEAAMRSFVGRYKSFDSYMWQPALIAERMTHWILHAPLILSNSDLVYRSAVLNILVKQARHLEHAITQCQGFAAIKAGCGLCISGLLIPEGESRTKKGLRIIKAQLDDFMFVDGGIKSRSPAEAIQIIEDLITLRSVLESQEYAEPDWLQITFDRMIPYFKALTHGDGSFAQFGGAFAIDARKLDEIIALTRAKGKALHNLPYSGYQRLKKQRTVLVVDIAPPPQTALSQTAGLSQLSFEMSDGRDRIIVNTSGRRAGYVGNNSEIFWKSRERAMHSGLSLEGLNFPETYRDHPIAFKHEDILYARNESDEGVLLEVNQTLQHLGNNFRHFRRLYLNHLGTDVRGEDTISRGSVPWYNFSSEKNEIGAVLHFHLHPNVAASFVQGGSSIILRLAHGHGWNFTSKGADVAMEDSVYLDRLGKEQRTKQITLSKSVRQGEDIKILWSFKRIVPQH